MKNKTLVIRMTAAAVGIMVMAGICAGQTYWKRMYGYTWGLDGTNAITPSSDGNFIVVGGSDIYNDFGNDRAGGLFLLKINPHGDSLWIKTYLNGTANAMAIALTSDGNFIVAGYTRWPGGSVGDVCLLKIKPDGDTLWTKTYGGSGQNMGAYAITPTLDGNFIVAGFAYLMNPGESDVYLLKINPDGDTLWTKKYGGMLAERAYAITSTQDTNFIVAGYTTSFGAGVFDVYLLKIKPDGDTLWTKTYGGKDWEKAYAITPTPDGDFIVAGYTGSFGYGFYDYYLLKVKLNGDTIWTKTYGGGSDEEATNIIPSSDGNFFVVGSTRTFGAGWCDVYLVKIKPNGDTLWTKTYGGAGAGFCQCYSPNIGW
jgi:hypothetical protein